MDWTYIRLEALLPLVIALGATLAIGAWKAIRLNRAGGSSRVAALRLLRTVGLAFPLSFLGAGLWHGWSAWQTLAEAALGRGPGLCAMGALRSSGQFFLKKDHAKAAYWFRRAADAGDARGRYYHARTLAFGTGVARNPAEALVWSRRAGEQGEADALLLTGDLLAQSRSAEADTWYRAARLAYEKQLPQADACLAIGLLHAQGKGTPRDPVEGLAWLYLARRQGLDPLRSVAVQMLEASLAKAQRDQATVRAGDIARSMSSGKGPVLSPP